jgi:hypothetical protein
MVDAKEEVKIEVKDVIKPEVDTPAVTSVFVTEDDKFDVTVEFYKDNGKMIVRGVDDSFDITRKSENFTVTVKYPSQGDVELIYSSSGKSVDPTNPQEISIPDFLRLELSRLLILIRKWSAGPDLTAEKIYQLNPKIVKAIILKIRAEIGMEGII